MLTVPQLVNKFSALYGNNSFSTEFINSLSLVPVLGHIKPVQAILLDDAF
jgi:hypothetical protein